MNENESTTEIGFVELRRWMRAKKLTLKDMELRSGVERNLLWRLMNGQRQVIGITDADRIVAATDGEITLDQVRAFERRMRRFRAAMRT